jgi:hypothetical protein
MLKLAGATALSLTLAVATPAFAVGPGGGVMHVGSGGFRGGQVGSVMPNGPDVAHCVQRWAYYDRSSGKYMGDDGQWRPCL